MSVHTNLITCNNYEISQNRIEISAFVLSIVTRNTFTTPLYMKYTKYSAVHIVLVRICMVLMFL